MVTVDDQSHITTEEKDKARGYRVLLDEEIPEAAMTNVEYGWWVLAIARDIEARVGRN
jgi:hypothetical protein